MVPKGPGNDMLPLTASSSGESLRRLVAEHYVAIEVRLPCGREGFDD